MSRGTPDYGIPEYEVAIEQNDLSIMALIDGGFTFMDGKGRLVWYDNFKQGLYKWNSIATGGAGTPVHLIAEDFSYGFYGSVELHAAVVNGVSAIEFIQNISLTKRVGTEFYVSRLSSGGRVSLQVQGTYTDNLTYMAELFVEEGTGDLFIITPSGNVRIYDVSAVAALGAQWTNIKLVIDIQSGMYYRAVLSGHNIDISSYAIPTTATGIRGRVKSGIYNTGKTGGATGRIYVGGVFVTVDEP